MSTQTAAELAREKAAKLLRRRGSASSLASSHAKVPGSVRQGSVSTTSYQPDHHRFAPQRFENSYRLEPNVKFNAANARHTACSVLESYLADEKYEPELCASMSKQLSEVIRTRIKMQAPRYKVVVMVTIGQLGGQDLRITSRCLWDSTHDNSATANYSNDTLFAVAYIFAVYYD